MLELSDTALRDIYEANKTRAKDPGTALVGTRQQQTLGRNGIAESDVETVVADHSLPLP